MIVRLADQQINTEIPLGIVSKRYRLVQHSELLTLIREKLHSGFGIDHLTIQMETLEREAEAVYICDTGTNCFEPASKEKSASVR